MQWESTRESRLFHQEAPEKLTVLLSSSLSDDDCGLACHAIRLKRRDASLVQHPLWENAATPAAQDACRAGNGGGDWALGFFTAGLLPRLCMLQNAHLGSVHPPV